jgi:hypothetical protein
MLELLLDDPDVKALQALLGSHRLGYTKEKLWSPP